MEPTSGWIFKPLIVEPTEDRFFFLMRSKLRLECCRKRKLKTFFVAKERSPLVVGHVCCFSPRLSTLPRDGWNAGFYFSRSEELGWKKGGGDGTGSRLPCLLLPILALCSNPWFLQTQIQRQHNTKNKDMASGWVRYRLQTVELVADTVIFCKNTKEKVNAHFTRPSKILMTCWCCTILCKYTKTQIQEERQVCQTVRLHYPDGGRCAIRRQVNELALNSGDRLQDFSKYKTKRSKYKSCIHRFHAHCTIFVQAKC